MRTEFSDSMQTKDEMLMLGERFNLIAEGYDSSRKKFIPCFDDFYGMATDFILSNFSSPKFVLDLGAGTGLLTSYWYKQCPATTYLLVDLAKDMLNVAQKRFAGISNISTCICDYTLAFPAGNYDAIISALSIHHLDFAKKNLLFKKIYDALPTGGIFCNYDQFCSDSLVLDKWFDEYWAQQVSLSGLTEQDITLWQGRKKFDKECSVDTEKKMLMASGFSAVDCIYSYHKFSVLVAIK